MAKDQDYTSPELPEHIHDLVEDLEFQAIHYAEKRPDKHASQLLDSARVRLRTEIADILESLDRAERNVTTSDVQAKTAEAAEKQPDPPSQGDEPAKPAEPYATFQTLEELTRFVEKMTNTVRVIAHEEACRKGREDMEQFKEEQALKRKLLSPGEIYAELNFLEEAHEAVCEVLECVPDLESELAGQVNEAATRAFSRLSMVLRWGAREREDIDVSDNEGAEGCAS